MQIRPLDPNTDRALTAALFGEARDYIWLERNAESDNSLLDEFFNDAPPGCDPAASLRLGLFDGATLLGIAELSFGYPTARDAYLGLMIFAKSARGKGAGAHFLRHLESEARARACETLCLAVLDANPKGRAFWDREGFTLALANREVTLGKKTQIAHRLSKRL